MEVSAIRAGEKLKKSLEIFGGLGYAPTGNVLRIHPSEFKSGVNLEQKLLEQLH